MMLSTLVEDYKPIDQFRVRFDRFKINQHNSFERTKYRTNHNKVKFPKLAFGTNPDYQPKIKYESPRRFYDRNYSHIDKKLRIPSMRQQEHKQSKSLNIRDRVQLSQHENFFLQTQNFMQSRIIPNLYVSQGRTQKLTQKTDFQESLKLNLLPMSQKELNESLITLLNKYQIANQVRLNYDDP